MNSAEWNDRVLRRGFRALATLIALFAFAISASAADAPAIRSGSELDFRPYSFTDKDGQPTGFGVELLRTVADKMGLRLQITPGPWDERWADLVAGRIDVLPVVARTSGREPLVDFSLPHTETFDAFFVRKGQPAFPNLAAAAGKQIVVLREDAAHHQLVERKFAGQVIPVESIPAGLRLVAAGRHDAFLCSKIIGLLEMRAADIQGVTGGPPIPDYKRVFSFGVRKGHAELVEKLNQGLLIVKTDGTYEQIYRRWLTVEDPWSKWLPYFKVVVVGLLVLAGLVVVLQWLVRRRTRELKRATVAMEVEVAERRHAQAALQQLNATLEQRVAERTAEVRESEERMQQALRISHSFTFEWHPATEKVLRSDSCGPILGLTGNEAVNDTGQNYFHRVHPDDRARFVQMLRDLTPAAANYAVEYLVTRPDGSAVVLEEVGQASFDATGKLERLTGVATDITTRKQAEENLNKSTADLKAANTSLRESRTAAMNLMKDAVEARQAAEQAEIQLQKANFELELRVAERTRELENTLQDLMDETTWRIQAVEALREKEQMLIQQSRQAAMGEMIGNIAHQWRQPLNTLGLAVQQLLLFYDMGEFSRELLAKNVTTSQDLIKHMSTTIDDFRNFFRPDKEKAEFKVNVAITGTLSLIEDSFKNQHISVEVVARAEPVILGYQNEFGQVLLNILNNARDAFIECGTEDPRVNITIGAEENRAVVTVADNAGGIPEEIMDRIFDPYFTTKGPQQGTGVGLFMSKTIIEKNMGGRLSARNTADGAEFRIEV